MSSPHPSLASVAEVVTTDRELAAAFTEWHRRWVEEPRRFISEMESLATPDQSYGQRCAAYLLKVLAERTTPAPAVPLPPA